jgi:hypothetical protein
LVSVKKQGQRKKSKEKQKRKTQIKGTGDDCGADKS